MQDINEIKSEIQWILAHRKITMSDIRHYNAATGGYFFARKTMKFFAGRIESAPYQGIGGIYFITSEKCGFTSTIRKFAVRKFNPETGDVTTVGDTFNKFSFIEDARADCRTFTKYGDDITERRREWRDEILKGSEEIIRSQPLMEA